MALKNTAVLNEEQGERQKNYTDVYMTRTAQSVCKRKYFFIESSRKKEIVHRNLCWGISFFQFKLA